MNVPKLRFKEFTDEWKIIKLDELYEFKNGINTDRTAYGKGVPLISVTDIINNNFITYNKIRGKIDINNKILMNNSVEYGDILFQRSSETFAEIGTSNIYLDNKIVTFGGFVIRGKKKNNEVPLFINYELKSPNSRKKIIIKGAGAQHYNIGQEDLRQVSIYVPSKEEQTKIADFLSLLDKKIELQTKKIEDLKLYKKGLFSNITFDTTQKFKLEDILQEQNEKSTVINQYDILSSTANGLFLQSEYFNKQAASENNIGYKILKRNQLVLSPQNLWMGNININDKYDIGIVSPSYKIFNINTSIINIQYFNNWIRTPRALYEYMISSEQGASIVRRNLNMDLFNSIIIKLPPINIQNKIGENIYSFNRLIELESNKLIKLQKLKKGFMQNMFV